MKKLSQYHFYYGAILNAIFECNPDASPTLLQATEKRGIYKIMTNTSKECIVFCKYAFRKNSSKNTTYESWSFTFSEDDKQLLEMYYNKKYPVFIYFLCAIEDLKNSEIAICTYEEFTVVQDKKTITVGREKNKSYFNLHTEKQRSTGIHLDRNRIKRKNDEIIMEIIDFDPEHYKPKHSITINLGKENIKYEKRYERPVSGQMIRYLSLSYRDDNICPIHNIKMPSIYVHIGKLKDTAYFCDKCGRYMIPSTRYKKLLNNISNTHNSIEFEVIANAE